MESGVLWCLLAVLTSLLRKYAERQVAVTVPYVE